MIHDDGYDTLIHQNDQMQLRFLTKMTTQSH